LTAGPSNVISYNVTELNDKRKLLTPLEQMLMDYVWTHPDCTADACREGLAKQKKLKDSTIRTVLRKLEEKGYASHSVDGRTFLYRAIDSRRNVAVQAAKQLIDRFCGGSVEELLVGLVDNQLLEPKQMQRLADKITARKGKKT
jgi:BlaI family penicillinase repressor